MWEVIAMVLIIILVIALVAGLAALVAFASMTPEEMLRNKGNCKRGKYERNN